MSAVAGEASRYATQSTAQPKSRRQRMRERAPHYGARR